MWWRMTMRGGKLEEGLILASDPRPSGRGQLRSLQMTVLKRREDRVLVLLSAGGLAATRR